MTVYEGSPNEATTTSTTPSAGDAARAVADKAPEVARDAAGHTKDVASDVAGQAKVVVGQATDHLRDLIGQARGELTGQADARTQQAATGLQTLSGQLSALRDGRPHEAGALTTYLGDAEQRVSGLADRLQRGGAQGALNDLTGFARRRPGLFIAGAVGLGFLVGRVARSGAAVAKEQHDAPDAESSQSVSSAPLDPFLVAPVMPDVVDLPLAVTR